MARQTPTRFKPPTAKQRLRHLKEMLARAMSCPESAEARLELRREIDRAKAAVRRQAAADAKKMCRGR